MITYLFITAGLVMASLWDSRNKFVELMQVNRYRAFVRSFPDHPVVQWHDEENAARIHRDKKSEVVSALGHAGLLLLWPVTIPASIVGAGYVKLAEKNDKMTYPVFVDHDRIREEEGR
jgi:hypothetical protein